MNKQMGTKQPLVRYWLTARLKLILPPEAYVNPLVWKCKAISSLKKYQTSRGASITADLESHQKGSGCFKTRSHYTETNGKETKLINFSGADAQHAWGKFPEKKLDIHGSVHRNIKLDIHGSVHRNIKLDVHESVHRNIKLDVHGSVHRNIKLIERTNKMEPCSRIY
jgi:hypothetical protein